MFFADNSRDCIWVMERTGGALPNPGADQALPLTGIWGGGTTPMSLLLLPGA